MTDVAKELRLIADCPAYTSNPFWRIISNAITRGADEIERLRAENARFRQGLFGGNVTAPRDDLAASQGPKQPANQ